MNDITITQLKKKLKAINKMGFILTHRYGDTGIGKTLEDVLEIRENNIPLCDIGKVAELKAYRREAISMLTLFTLEPRPKGGDRDRFLLDNFGYSKRDNQRPKELYSTVICKNYNPQGLKLSVEKYRIDVLDRNGGLDIYWGMEMLKDKFSQKLPALVYVLADRKFIKWKEHFHFNEAYYLSGFEFDSFKEMIKKDFVVVDFRMHYRPNGSVRNHGTGFRVKINKLYNCFDNKIKLI